MLEVRDLILLNQKRVNLEVFEGEYVQILGPNGSGKSLFLKSLCQIIPCSFEKLTLNQKSSSDLSIEEWRRKIIYLSSQIFERLDQSIEDFLNFPLNFKIYKDFSPTFDPFKSIADKTKRLNQLSTGEKQQVLILRALMLSPEILILDETLSNLDEAKRSEMISLIKSQCHLVKCALFVSHFDLGNAITRKYYL